MLFRSQEFKLVHGTWDVRGEDGQTERVRPQDIKTAALLTVEGELDDISGSGQTRAAQDLCTGIPKANRQHLEVEGAGHYGIFSGRRWRDVVYPQVKAFIAAHALPQTVRGKTSAKPAVAVGGKAAAKATRKAAKPASKTTAKTSAKTSAKTRSTRAAWGKKTRA